MTTARRISVITPSRRLRDPPDQPGAMALTRIPRGASSNAVALVIVMTAALEAP